MIVVMATKPTTEEIKKFVKEALTRANNARIECIDGRYTPEQSEGALRAPGGDFGMVMAIAGALKDEGTYLEPEEIVERYLTSVMKKRGSDAQLYFHDDDSSHAIGCGHIARASSPEHEGLYGSLTHQEVGQLYEVFTSHPRVHKTVLEGPHAEKGVIVVAAESEEAPVPYTINSRDAKGNMYFVADIDRANRFIDKVVPHFSQGLVKPVSSEDVKRNFLIQLNATVTLLAGDKEKFKVTIGESGEFSMNQLPKLKPSSQV